MTHAGGAWDRADRGVVGLVCPQNGVSCVAAAPLWEPETPGPLPLLLPGPGKCLRPWGSVPSSSVPLPPPTPAHRPSLSLLMTPGRPGHPGPFRFLRRTPFPASLFPQIPGTLG